MCVCVCEREREREREMCVSNTGGYLVGGGAEWCGRALATESKGQ